MNDESPYLLKMFCARFLLLLFSLISSLIFRQKSVVYKLPRMERESAGESDRVNAHASVKKRQLRFPTRLTDGGDDNLFAYFFVSSLLYFKQIKPLKPVAKLT